MIERTEITERKSRQTICFLNVRTCKNGLISYSDHHESVWDGEIIARLNYITLLQI